MLEEGVRYEVEYFLEEAGIETTEDDIDTITCAVLEDYNFNEALSLAIYDYIKEVTGIDIHEAHANRRALEKEMESQDSDEED